MIVKNLSSVSFSQSFFFFFFYLGCITFCDIEIGDKNYEISNEN